MNRESEVEWEKNKESIGWQTDIPKARYSLTDWVTDWVSDDIAINNNYHRFVTFILSFNLC